MNQPGTHAEIAATKRHKTKKNELLFPTFVPFCGLEPALLVLYVRSHKVFVRLRQIDDSFDQADDPADTTKAEHQLDDPFGRVSENELVHSKPADQNRADAGRDLLVCAQCFPVSHGSGINRLHWLIAADDWREWLLAVRTILRSIIVNGTAFCAVSAHPSHLPQASNPEHWLITPEGSGHAIEFHS